MKKLNISEMEFVAGGFGAPHVDGGGDEYSFDSSVGNDPVEVIIRKKLKPFIKVYSAITETLGVYYNDIIITDSPGGIEISDEQEECTCGADVNGDGESDFGPPNGNGELRSSEDRTGGANFGDSRGRRDHKGTDYAITNGSSVQSIVSGKVTNIRDSYRNDSRFTYVEVTTSDGYVVEHHYVGSSVKLGDTVTKGQDIGTYQSLQDKYPGIGMHDHVNVEITKDGIHQNPDELINPNKSTCPKHGGG
jgi:murein DD-endopeptidase MepM/ murein hydrolase activator NlpD